MQNYWIGIMAAAFVVALAAWLLLVFNADRHPPRGPQESSPQREVIGGEFEAREGGRQLMPHPAQPSEPSADTGADTAAAPVQAGAGPGQGVPSQRVPGQSVPGQRRPGQSVPGQAAPGQERPAVAGHGSSLVPEQGAAPRSEPAAPVGRDGS